MGGSICFSGVALLLDGHGRGQSSRKIGDSEGKSEHSALHCIGWYWDYVISGVEGMRVVM